MERPKSMKTVRFPVGTLPTERSELASPSSSSSSSTRKSSTRKKKQKETSSGAVEALKKIADKANYTRCYCEENVWHLSVRVEKAEWPSFAVFASNRQQRCPIWYQRAAKDDDAPCLWDYHVFLIVVVGKAVVVDLDTTLPVVSDAALYVQKALLPALKLPPEFHPVLRLVAADQFIDNFASDRRHMRTHNGWLAPVPKTDPIHPEQGSNLQNYIDCTSLDDENWDLGSPEFVHTVETRANRPFGVTLDLPTFYAWIDLANGTAGAAQKIIDHHHLEQVRLRQRSSHVLDITVDDHQRDDDDDLVAEEGGTRDDDDDHTLDDN